jgi:hypothetical protein
MWFFLVRSLIPMRADPGDSTDIIHKRILKGTRHSEPGRGDPCARVSPGIGFIYWDSRGPFAPATPSEPTRVIYR